MSDKGYAVGVDIGGSHISCALMDMTNNTLLNDIRVYKTINNSADSNEILAGWSEAIRQVLAYISMDKCMGIGFGMPGPFDYIHGVGLFQNVEKYGSLYGISVATELRKHLELPYNLPVRFINDATAFAIGEHWLGNIRDIHRALCITLGTGFGSTFLENGLPVMDRTDVPVQGFLYNQPVGDGIADDYFSTRWFVNRYYELAGKRISGVKSLVTLARSDDSMALDVFKEFGQNFSRFLMPWFRSFSPERVVLGGNIAGGFPVFKDFLYSELMQQDNFTPFYISELGEDASLAGSARLCDENYWNRIKGLLKYM